MNVFGGREAAPAIFFLLCVFGHAACFAEENPVLAWNAKLIACVRKETSPPNLVARNLALLHVAMYLAVEDAVKASLSEKEIGEAADAAGAEISGSLYPAQRGELARRHFSEKTGVIGRRCGEAVLAWRANDGASTGTPYIPSAKPGQWRRTEPGLRPPETPNWGRTRPFVLEEAAQFRPPPPPTLDSAEYTRALAEVRELGGEPSSARTEEKTMIARFWSDFSYTCTPPGHWNDIARDVVRARDMSLRETARLFALLNVSMADVGIACWETKYRYNAWRPITAIRRADEDGNAATPADAAWKSLLPSPPHPEYVSGHAAFSGAAAAVLTERFGDGIEFAVASDGMPGTTRRFQSLRACAEEIARSRVYAGIHFSFSGERGLALGRDVARFATEHFDRLLPTIGERPLAEHSTSSTP